MLGALDEALGVGYLQGKTTGINGVRIDSKSEEEWVIIDATPKYTFLLQAFNLLSVKHVSVKFLFLSTLFFIGHTVFAQKSEEAQIQKLLTTQTEAWNRGDLEGFMQTYWKNDSLMFIGRNGIKWGWQETLNNYKKGYPDTTAMGKLSFNILVVKKLSPHYFYVVGKWMLRRTIGDISGHFDLLLQKIKGRWYIIADHSS